MTDYLDVANLAVTFPRSWRIKDMLLPWGDVRFGVRQLRLNPTFTLVAVASLVLGIGANTAIFPLIDAIRLRSLRVGNPRQLDFA